jgi:hypothetical protein
MPTAPNDATKKKSSSKRSSTTRSKSPKKDPSLSDEVKDQIIFDIVEKSEKTLDDLVKENPEVYAGKQVLSLKCESLRHLQFPH